jgi:hypothetical protein
MIPAENVQGAVMKQRYLTLMEKALSAYTDEHILRYYRDVKEHGMTEHGFPRLTANIGILLAHGKRTDLLPLFCHMMDLCCDMFLRPYVHAANEFSIREIVCCIHELETAKIIETETLSRWKEKITAIRPEACYTVLVRSETDRITNWAIFGAVSEYARFYFGLGENLDFVDRQLSCQLQWLDENGMYCDNPKEIPHQPIIYDYASRGLFAMLLHFGYRGTYSRQLDDCLRQAGQLTLAMQSSNGEVPFGGRSNQFLHNEPWMMLLFEYEARRYVKEGNHSLAAAFKAAVARGMSVTETWLEKAPIRHIKNRFPTETKYGCEEYAYFDKYMITVASNLYAAYLLCDDTIPTVSLTDHTPSACQTSHHFHKLFLKSGGYALEFDTNGDPHYDAGGLGRIHKEGAPSSICLSCPCPAEPLYETNRESPFAFSLCSAKREGDTWRFGAEPHAKYEVLCHRADANEAHGELLCRFPDGQSVREKYAVSAFGVSVTLVGNGELGYALPALCFDGESSPEILAEEHSLTVFYEGFCCRYTTDGKVIDSGRIAANRNGHYRVFLATAEDTLCVSIEIIER